MRTTLTLDDDVAAQLEGLRTRGGRPFKQVVDDVLRAGLAQVEREEQASRGPYTRSVFLGEALLPDLDDVSETLALVEGDDHW